MFFSIEKLITSGCLQKKIESVSTLFFPNKIQ